MGAAQVADGSGDGGIVAFRTSACEKYGARSNAKYLSYAFTCVLDGQPGFAAKRVNGRRIAKLLRHVWEHGFQHFPVEGRCGCIVEIDAVILLLLQVLLDLVISEYFVHGAIFLNLDFGN